MGKNTGLQSRDILRKIEEFNTNNIEFAKIIIIRDSLTEQMVDLIYREQEEEDKEALGDIYLKVIYGLISYRGCRIHVSPIANSVEDGILIG